MIIENEDNAQHNSKGRTQQNKMYREVGGAATTHWFLLHTGPHLTRKPGEYPRIPPAQPPERSVPEGTSSGCSSGWGALAHAREFCQNTSLHGLQYVGEISRHPTERIFWLLSFLLAMTSAALLIQNLWQGWGEHPVLATISTSPLPITSIPFPAITVCNMNNARRSVAESILNPSARYPGVDQERILLRDTCDMNNLSAPLTHSNPASSQPSEGTDDLQWDAIKDFMIKVNEPCHELLLTCRWAGETRSCNNLFNTVFTDEGLCCAFNRMPRDKLFRNPQDLPDLNLTFPFPSLDWSPEQLHPPDTPEDTLPWRPAGAGKHLGLSIVLDVEVEDYFCSSTASAGLKMLLHSPVESPKLSSFGFAISPGKENFVVVRSELVRSSGRLRQVALTKRRCFFLNERTLRFYRSYTKHNCALECEANYTLSRCGCVQYFMPKDKSTRICGKADDICADRAKSEVELHLHDESRGPENPRDQHPSPSCHCLPGCSEVAYGAELSSAALTDSLPGHRKYLAATAHRNRLNNSTYFKNNVVILHFFFVDMQVVSYEKTERTTYVDFLASTGGLLGLFHGFSVLSAVEVLYYLSLRLWCSWRRPHRATVHPPPYPFLP